MSQVDLDIRFRSVFRVKFDTIHGVEKLVGMERISVSTTKGLLNLLGDRFQIRPRWLVPRVEQVQNEEDCLECIKIAAENGSHVANVYLNFSEYKKLFRWFDLDHNVFKYKIEEISLSPFNSKGPLFLNIFVYAMDNGLDMKEFLCGCDLHDVLNVQEYVKTGDPYHLGFVKAFNLSKVLQKFDLHKDESISKFYFPKSYVPPSKPLRNRVFFLTFDFDLLFSFGASKSKLPRKWVWNGDCDYIESAEKLVKSSGLVLSCGELEGAINLTRDPTPLMRKLKKNSSKNMNNLSIVFLTKQMFIKSTLLPHPFHEKHKRIEALVNGMIKSGWLHESGLKVKLYHM